MSNAVTQLTIYSRDGCHLCEDMSLALKEWQKSYAFNVKIVDIDKDPILTRRFAARIPVLTSGRTEICQYYLDDDALIKFFESGSTR